MSCENHLSNRIEKLKYDKLICKLIGETGLKGATGLTLLIMVL